MEIISGKLAKPDRVVLYGQEGVGKSTLAANFPTPLFIDTEGSTDSMNVDRISRPKTWTELINYIKEFRFDPKGYQTLVIDTADWAEKLCIEHICTTNGYSGIEDAGYGKGYTYVEEAFCKLLDLLDRVRNDGIFVVITAHAIQRKVELPEATGSYDHWEMKCSKKVSAKIKEWADDLLFLAYNTKVVTDSKTNKTKAKGSERVIRTTHFAAWDAKNRCGFDDVLPLTIKSLMPIFKKYEDAYAIEEEKRKAKSARLVPIPLPDEEPAEPAPAPKPTATAQTAEKPKEKAEKPASDGFKTATGTAAVEAEAQFGKDKNPYDGIDERLVALMQQAGIEPHFIEAVCEAKGRSVAGTPMSKYNDKLVGWIIKFWDRLLPMALDAREKSEVPFN